MGKALADPERPFVAILGGAKVSDKLNVINNLLEKVDTLIIGGGMAYTFLAAKGYGIGKSLFDAEKVDYCKDMMKKAEEKGVKLLLPVDTVVAAEFPNPIDAPIDVKTVDVSEIPADMEGMDIGEKTRALFADAVKSAKTVVWNGPMGVFENPTLAKGTIAVAQALADSRPSPSSAAATPQRHASSWALPTRLPTSRPAAARPLNSSRAWSFPELRACRISKLFERTCPDRTPPDLFRQKCVARIRRTECTPSSSRLLLTKNLSPVALSKACIRSTVKICYPCAYL